VYFQLRYSLADVIEKSFNDILAYCRSSKSFTTTEEEAEEDVGDETVSLKIFNNNCWLKLLRLTLTSFE
jgi:hypothetical protein